MGINIKGFVAAFYILLENNQAKMPTEAWPVIFGRYGRGSKGL